jgi:hypothetical protein
MTCLLIGRLSWWLLNLRIHLFNLLKVLTEVSVCIYMYIIVCVLIFAKKKSDKG